MSAGLTFKGVSKIEHIIPGQETHTTDPAKYEVVSTGFVVGVSFFLLSVHPYIVSAITAISTTQRSKDKSFVNFVFFIMFFSLEIIPSLRWFYHSHRHSQFLKMFLSASISTWCIFFAFSGFPNGLSSVCGF